MRLSTEAEQVLAKWKAECKVLWVLFCAVTDAQGSLSF